MLVNYVDATATAGATFANWIGSGTGSYSGTTNPIPTLTMNNAITEQANFTGGNVICTNTHNIHNATNNAYLLLVVTAIIFASSVIVGAVLYMRNIGGDDSGEDREKFYNNIIIVIAVGVFLLIGAVLLFDANNLLTVAQGCPLS